MYICSVTEINSRYLQALIDTSKAKLSRTTDITLATSMLTEKAPMINQVNKLYDG
jgi:hypothetical protein